MPAGTDLVGKFNSGDAFTPGSTGGTFTVTPAFAIDDLLIFTIATFVNPTIAAPFTITDNGSANWQVLTPPVTNSGIRTLVQWYKFATAADLATGSLTTVTLTWGGSGGGNGWWIMDDFTNSSNVPLIDSNWVPNSTTMWTSTAQVSATGSIPTVPGNPHGSGQSPVGTGLSQQAYELIYIVWFNQKGAKGNPNFVSNSPSITTPTQFNTINGGNPSNLISAYATSDGTAPFSTLDNVFAQWTQLPSQPSPAIMVVSSFYDPGIADLSVAPQGSVTITHVAVASDVATLTSALSLPPQFAVGSTIVVAGLSHTALNGTWTITSLGPTGNTLTFSVTTGNVSTTTDSGTATGPPSNQVTGGAIYGAGQMTFSIGLAPAGRLLLPGTFIGPQGVGANGSTAYAYRLYRFAGNYPVQGQALPSGSPDSIGAVTTGDSFGSDGAYMLNVPVVDDYLVAVVYSGGSGTTIDWRLFSAGSVAGQGSPQITLDGITGDMGGPDGKSVDLTTANAGDTSDGNAASIHHKHKLADAYLLPGEIHIGMGDGAAARLQLPSTDGWVPTSLPTATPGTPPIVWAAPTWLFNILPKAVSATTVTGPGEIPFDGSGGGFPFNLPLAATAPPGYYAFHRVPTDLSGNFVGLIPYPGSGDTIDGALQWGSVNAGDELVIAPFATGPSTGYWMVVRQPETLGYLYADIKYMGPYGYPTNSGFILMLGSPGPYGASSGGPTGGEPYFVASVGSGSTWQAIIEVGDGSNTPYYQFTGRDVTQVIKPCAANGSGGGTMTGTSAVILAVGALGHPHNPTSAWSNLWSSPYPTDLGPNQALVGYNGNTVLGGTGQVGFPARESFIDDQYPASSVTINSGGQPETGTQKAYGDGRYAYHNMVTPPSGLFDTYMSVSWKYNNSGNPKTYFALAAAFPYYLDNTRSGLFTPEAFNIQDLVAIGSSETEAIPAQSIVASDYNRWETHRIGQTLGTALDGSAGPVLIPAGYPIRLYWRVLQAWPVGSGGQLGDGTGWQIEDVYYHMVTKRLPGGPTVYPVPNGLH
jgi:hypothetical protein